MRDRFFDKVMKEPNTGCWLWTGADDPMGYGRFALNGKNASAHRVSYELAGNQIPEGMSVLHHSEAECVEAPPCVDRHCPLWLDDFEHFHPKEEDDEIEAERVHDALATDAFAEDWREDG